MLEQTRRFTRRTLPLAFLVMAGCGDPIGAGLDWALEGTFKDIDGLTLEVDGDALVVTDFGSSVLGTNTSVFPIGSAYIDHLACDASSQSCTGRLVDPTVMNGELVGAGARVDAQIAADGSDRITVTSQLGTKTFSRDGSGTGAEVPAQLSQTASCDQWWAVLTSRPEWRVTYFGNNDGAYDGYFTNHKMSFFGTNGFNRKADFQLDGGDVQHIDETTTVLKSMVYGETAGNPDFSYQVCQIYPQTWGDGDPYRPPLHMYSWDGEKVIIGGPDRGPYTTTHAMFVLE